MADVKHIAVAVFFNNNLYLSIFSVGRYFLFIPVCLLLIPLFRIKNHDFAMYVTGFSISSFEILILMAFQVVFGYVYAASGIIFAICMAGLAIGAYLGSVQKGNPDNKEIIINQTLFGILIVIFTLCIINLDVLPAGILLYIAFFIFILIPSILAGRQFSYIIQFNQISSNSISGKVYALDLFGSALGAYITSVLLLPVIGFMNMGLLIGIINFIVILILLFRNNFNK